eukprot:Skav213306  [mRNA]  locus=scaffold2480:656625:659279:- [translate_table: standard]
MMAEIEPQQQRADLGLPLVQWGDEIPQEVSVEDTAGCFSLLTYSWVGPLISMGHHREELRRQGASGAEDSLTETDLLFLREDDLPDKLSQAAWHAWQDQKAAPKPSLIRALLRAFGRALQLRWV